jgi:uncharacterized protein (TIGR02996 family)
LLGAVLAKPDDDAPRLAYADWLADNRQPERAEFIRLQIERARRPRRDPTRLCYGDRELALWQAHAAQWLMALPEAARRHAKFERGFPGRVEPELIDFLNWDDSLWQVAPVTTLWLGDRWLHDGVYREGLDKEREMRALAAKSQLAHIRFLDTMESGYFGLEELEILFTSPHLSGLRQLIAADISSGPPKQGDAIVPLLDGARDLSGLRWLSLEADGISDAGVEALLASRLLPQLTELVLGNNNITDAGVELLASSPRLAKLESLHLYCNCIGDRGAHALAASRHLRHLKEISLMGNNISEEPQAVLRERFGDRLAL